MRNVVLAGVFFAMASWCGSGLAQDLDLNGLSDTAERFLADRFKPVITYHASNFMQPVPVEILDRSGNGVLDIDDMDVSIYDLRGYRLQIGTFCTLLPAATSCSEPWQLFRQNMRGSANGGLYEGFLDYGGAGNETSDGWRDTYFSGNSTTLPGEAYEPTVYCHFMAVSPSEIVIQYWFFYPFNDGWNNHESDWEHINVVVTNDPTNSGFGSQIVAVDYFYHEQMWTNVAPLTIQGTHPVVCVGGVHTHAPFYVPEGLGEITGASWPCFGTFTLPSLGGVIPVGDELVNSGGRTLLPEDVQVKIIPNCQLLENYNDGPDLTSWFEAHPENHWMRLALYWGHPASDSPIGEGNRAVISPMYRPEWQQRGSSTNDACQDAWNERDPVVMTAARAGGEIIAVEHQYESGTIFREKVGTSNISIFNTPFHAPQDLVVTMADEHVLPSGDRIGFVGWSDGVVENPRTMHFQRSDQDITYLEAQYRKRSRSWRGDNETLALWAGAGGAWGDYDCDGLDDLFLLTTSGSAVLLHNTGLGFEEHEFPPLMNPMASAAWGDFDNDGDLDLCVVPETYGSIQVFQNDSGFFVDVVSVWTDGAIAGATWVDVEADGDLDIVLWGSRDSYAQLLLVNGGEGSFMPSAEFIPCSLAGAAWGDYDGDGDLDLCALGNALSTGSVMRCDNGFFLPDPAIWRSTLPNRADFSAAWVDYDNDGDLDLWQDDTLWRMGEDGKLSFGLRLPLQGVAAFNYANWGDFNSDGWVDLIVNGRLFRNDAGEFVDLTDWIEWPAHRPGRWEWVDYDSDGDLDLFSFGNPIMLMENTEDPATGFVKVNLQGTVSNRHGIGATLNFPNGLRPICQNSGVANSATRGLIGIGDLAAPYEMVVTWPSGTRHSVTVAAGSNAISVIEPEGIAEFSTYPLVADGSEHSGVFAVRLSPSSGVVNAAVHLEALGVPEVRTLTDDGLGGDLVANDGIYTSTEFSATLDYAQYYYPIVTVDLADGSRLARRVNALLMPSVADLPVIESAASAPIWSVGRDVATTISVQISVPQGQVLWSAELDLNGLGTPSHLAMSDAGPGADGLGTDQVAGDGIYTSELFTANAMEGTHHVSALAQASSGGVTHQVVAVEAVPYAAKLTNVSDVPGQPLGISYSGTPYSAIAMDYDGGEKDLLLTQGDANAALLYQGQVPGSGGAPRFLQSIEHSAPDWRGAAAADFDNDGDTDYFIAGESSMMWQSGRIGGSSMEVTAALGLTGVDNATAACWGDYDRDGWLDLYVVRSNTSLNQPGFLIQGAQHRLFRNCLGDGGTGFVDVTASTGIGALANIPSWSACWLDVDQDGDLDLFVALAPYVPESFNKSLPPLSVRTLLFLNEDDGTFVESYQTQLAEHVTGVTAVVGSDVNNDAYPDLLVSMEGYGARAYINNGAGQFVADAIELRDSSLGYNGIAVVDQDLDGWKDVLLAPATANRSVELLLNKEWSGQRSFASGTVASGLGGDAPVVGLLATDFTNDGDAEVFAGMPFNVKDFFYKTDAQDGSTTLANAYLKIRLESPSNANNRQGIGAVVQITKTAGGGTGLQQVQIVDGGSGRGGQMDSELVFGLGDYEGPVKAKIIWPGGWVQYVDPLTGRGENVNVITDNSLPVISNVSAVAMINPTYGTLDWVFSWETDVSTNWKIDEVQFLPPTSGSNCLAGWSSIMADSPVVSHVYVAKKDGGYIHSITIPNFDCEPGCGFQYRVGSGSGTNKIYGTFYSKKVKVCPSQF